MPKHFRHERQKYIWLNASLIRNLGIALVLTALAAPLQAQFIATAFWKVSSTKYITLTGPATTLAGTGACSTAFSVKVYNKAGTSVAIGAATSVALAQLTNPTTATYFSDSTCTTPLPTSNGSSLLNFASTDAQKDFYFKHTVDEPVILKATPPTPMAAAAYPVANYLPPLVNASFKTPAQAEGVFTDYTSIPGWTGNVKLLANSTAYSEQGSRDGLQYAGYQFAAYSDQVITTWLGGAYFAKFYAHGRSYGNNELQFKADSSVVIDATPSTSAWDLETSSSFSLTAGTHTVSIVGVDPGGGDKTAFAEEVGVYAYALPPAPISQGLVLVGANLFLSIARVPQATSYTLYYRTAGSTGTFSSINFSEPQLTTTSIASAATMEYYVSSTNSIGEGPKGSVMSINGATDVTSKITNPSFEDPAISSGAFQYGGPITGWTTGSRTGLCNNGCPFQASSANAPNGNQVAFLQIAGNTALQQTVSGLTPNGQYVLTFDSSQRSGLNNDCEVNLNNEFFVFYPPGGAYVTYSAAMGVADGSGNLIILFHGIDSMTGDKACLVDNLHLYQLN